MLVSTGASDWLDSSGTAVRVDGGFRITARKMPASGCPAGDVLVTLGPIHALESIERAAIAQTLAQLGGNRSAAARALGIAPSTLYLKLKKYGIG